MRRSMLVSSAAALSLLVACASTGVRYHKVSPLPHQLQREAGLEAAASVLQQHGYTPSLVNDRLGMITTDWRTGGGLQKILFGHAGRNRVNVALSDSTFTLSGEYQMRQGASLLGAVFSDPDEEVHDTGWFSADPPDEVEEEWELVLSEIATRLGSLPPRSSEPVPAIATAPMSLGAIRTVATDRSLLGDSTERISVGVVDFTGLGLDEAEVRILSDRLRAELVDTGRFLVVERERMNEILQEQGFQQAGDCSSDACAVELGRLIGVNNMIAGSVGRLGQTYTSTVRLIDVETGEIIARASDDCQCEIDELLGSMQRLAAALSTGAE